MVRPRPPAHLPRKVLHESGTQVRLSTYLNQLLFIPAHSQALHPSKDLQALQ
ncbi:unnamed protein product [Lepidochelys kempii]